MRGRIPALLLLAAVACTDSEPDVVHTASVTFVVNGGSAGAVADPLRARLDALGLSPGEARVEGDRVTFGVTRALTATESAVVSRRGHLTFRRVAETGVAGQYADSDYRERLAETSGAPARDGETVTACDADGSATYTLDAAAMKGDAVKDARAEHQPAAGIQTGGWVVTLEMREVSAWADVTRRHLSQQLAIVLDGLVQSAPTVEQEIPDGHVAISGDFTEEAARTLAAVLRSGALPEGVTVTPA